ncbi:MAG: hypothetical protein AB7O47_10185 [Flavobacteriales bacterium]
MIKDFLISFKDNFREKTRNPFLGTYLIVWFIRNWELIYTLFNFDNDSKLLDKVNFIKNYYANLDFLSNLWTNVYWAFGVLILTYVLLNLSRLIVNLFEKKLTPWIYKITDSNSIVLKTVYQNMVLERDDIQIRLDQERESKSRLENRIKKLEEDLILATNIDTKLDKEKTNRTLKEVKKSSNESSDDSIKILFQKLKAKNLLKDFTDIAVNINKGEYLSTEDTKKDYFIELGLITFQQSHPRLRQLTLYKLTDDGEKVLKIARLE